MIKYYWLYLKLIIVNYVYYIDRYVIKILMWILIVFNLLEYVLWCWLFMGFFWKYLWNIIKVIIVKY